MPQSIDYFNSIINIESPTTSIDAQVLHDFIEDEMATPVGMQHPAIIQPEGKIEDPSQPGVFSQIIIILNSPWQFQFWGGSGYTRIFGGKLVGGLADEPIKATGTAGDITVLESPVDGLVVAGALRESEAADLQLIRQAHYNRRKLDILLKTMTVFDDDRIAILALFDTNADIATEGLTELIPALNGGFDAGFDEGFG